MSDVIDTEREWERSLLSSFVDIVQADYGDFTELDRLAKASFDISGFQKMIEHLSASPQGKKAFEERFSLSGIDLEQLRQLPPGTLGRVYAEHMIRNQLQPLQAPPAENPYQFLANHIRETHDI
ncbi:Coq4 family protein [Pannus brasiliensis CCIBt3594]|uniref:Coq4 family protein n=1 Tax=Pannus brasiliensis CCIBt3594 TaxID=1427578 RepID=A0AAW9QXA5_9CHRO